MMITGVKRNVFEDLRYAYSALDSSHYDAWDILLELFRAKHEAAMRDAIEILITEYPSYASEAQEILERAKIRALH